MRKRNVLIWLSAVLIVGCLGDHHDESPEETQLVEEARFKAINYLWDQIDPLTGLWPRKEVSQAILGVASHLAGVKGGVHSNFERQNETQIVFRNMERLYLDFFLRLNQSRSLQEVADAEISQITSALLLTCAKDPRDFFGYDLIAEIEDRLDQIFMSNDWTDAKEDPPLHYPALMLVLCNSGNVNPIAEHGDRVLDLMAIPNYKAGERYPLGVERAAMNALALRCLQDKFTTVSTTKKKLFNYAIKNLRYIYSMQESDGGFGTVYTTALAISAVFSRLVAPPKADPFQFKEAREWLLESQKEDGSFGSSITFTSLAIGGMSSRSINLLSKVNCEDHWMKDLDKFEIEIEITDEVFSKQTFIDRIPAEKGDALFDLLDSYAQKHPRTLKLEHANEGTGVVITSINDLKNEDLLGYSWKAYRGKNGELTAPIFDLETELVNDETTYILEYS